MQAYESIRYNEGKGTVKSKSYSVYGTDGQLLRQTPYSFTYGDPSKGEIPDALYKLETSGGSYSYAYDRLARLESRTLTVGNTVKTESYTYAPHPTNAALTTPLVSSMTDLAGKTHTYTYDANGNILTDTYDGNTVSYEYDSLNRMTRYNDPVFGRTYVYVYDDRGNITEMQDHSYTTGALSAYYSSCEYEYGDGTWADLMTSYWGEDIAYDELGNPLNWIWGDTLTWQNGRQLASVGGVTYGYNADGLRVSKTWSLGSTEYYIVDGQYIGEKTVNNGTQYYIYYIYDENGSPAGITVNGTQYWFVKNLQGDVTAILDSSGAVVANYRYDAYGYIISITNGSGANVGLTDTGHIARLNPFRYRGYMYDEETEFYYLRSRYYDPYIGRFLNADGYVSTGQGFTGYNMFAYCNNDPISHKDSTGTFATTVLGDEIVLKTCTNGKWTQNPLSYNPLDVPDTSDTLDTSTNNNEPVMPVNGVINRNDYPYYDVERKNEHRGTDIPVPENTPVVAAIAGTVIETNTTVNYNTYESNDGSYGIHVRIKLYTGETVIYAHLSSICVSVGQRVSAGDLIAYSGNTGNSSGPHLHYEVNDENGNPLNPYSYLPE